MKTVNTLMPPLEIPTKHGRANHAPQSRSRNRLGMSEDHLNHNTPPPRGLSDEDGGFSQPEEGTYHNLSLTFTHNAIGSVKPRPLRAAAPIARRRAIRERRCSRKQRQQVTTGRQSIPQRDAGMSESTPRGLEGQRPAHK